MFTADVRVQVPPRPPNEKIPVFFGIPGFFCVYRVSAEENIGILVRMEGAGEGVFP